MADAQTEMTDLQNRLYKFFSNTFSWEDLSKEAKKLVAEGRKVHKLKVGKWVRIGNFQVLLKIKTSNGNETYAYILTMPHIWWLNWLSLPLVSNSAPLVVLENTVIPGTNIIISMWYVGINNMTALLAAETDPSAQN